MAGDLYQHFKGGVYEVICEARNSETLEEMIVYRNVASGEMWVRPKEMFFDNHGSTQRFTKIVEAEVTGE